MPEESVPQPSAKKSTLPSLSVVEFPARHREFIIEDGIMPRREVHILAAASGAGKTTLMIQILDDLIEGNPVFDAPTHPVRAVYLCNDRSSDDIKRTFERVRPRSKFPFYSLLTDPSFKSVHSVGEAIRQAKALHSESDFIVYDPISRAVENVNSAREVGSLLCKLTEIAQELDVTILIIHHAAKVKTDAYYANPRQKMAGCGAWGGYSNLNLILEEDQESNPTNPIRSLHVCPRNGTNLYFRYVIDDKGCFVPAPELTKDHDRKAQSKAHDVIFNNLPLGPLTTGAICAALDDPSNGALYRCLKRWQKFNCIELISRGKYQKIAHMRGEEGGK